MRRFAVLLIALLCALPLAGQAEQVLRIGNGPEPETLDPQRSVNIPENQILQSLFEGLLTVDAAGRPVPGAAESWTVSEDGLTWRFVLRADGKWSDGRPVTAEDFVYGWRRAVDPATRPLFADLLYPVVNAAEIARGELPPDTLGVRADGPLVFEVRLVRPKPNFSDYLYHRATFPLQRASLEKAGAQFTRPGNLVGNGPYVLAEQVPQSHVGLVRNPHYHAAAEVKIDRVLYLVSDGGDAELTRFRAGELDITMGVPSKQVDWVQKNLPAALHEAPIARVHFLAPNLTREPWKSSRALRLALSMALDRELLSGRVLKDGAPLYSFVPPGLPDYRPAEPEWAHWTQAKRDAEAKRLFAEAGYGPQNPLTLEILVIAAQGEEQRAAVALAALWQQKLGVRSTITAIENKVFSGKVRERAYSDLALRYWQWLFPERFLEILRSEDERNGNGYHNAEFDAAMAEADRAVTREQFAAALNRAEALAMADAAVIPLSLFTARHLVAPRVRGWQDNLRDAHLVRYLSLAGKSGGP